MSRMSEIPSGEWVRPVMRGYKTICCGCGLVHVWDFRIRKGTLEFRVTRNERSTALTRRQNEYPCKP